MAITVPNTFVPSTLIKAEEVNANFASLDNRTQWVTPEMYGTINGTNDAAVIQLALDSGNNVFLGPKTYIVDSPLNMVTWGQHLVGSGKQKTIFKRSTTAPMDYYIKFGNDRTTGQTYPMNAVWNVRVSGIKFFGTTNTAPDCTSAIQQTTYGIYVNNAMEWEIEDCAFWDFYGGINVRGEFPSSAQQYGNYNGKIFNNHITRCSKFGIATGIGTSQTYIKHNTIDEIGPNAVNTSYTSYGIHLVSNSIGTIIRDNMIQLIGYRQFGSQAKYKTSHGIAIASHGTANTVIDGNYFEVCEITVQSNSTSGAGITTYPYPLAGQTGGTQFDAYTSDLVVTSNFMNGTQPTAFSLTNTGTATISGNTMGYYPQAAAGALWSGDGAEGYTQPDGFVNGIWHAVGYGVITINAGVSRLTFLNNFIPTSSWLNPNVLATDNTIQGSLKCDTTVLSGWTGVTGAVTPDVASKSYIEIPPTSAYQITNLINGIKGQIVHLVFFDTNSTVVHDTEYIRLNGSVNFVSSQGATLTLLNTSLNWVELSRSKP